MNAAQSRKQLLFSYSDHSIRAVEDTVTHLHLLCLPSRKQRDSGRFTGSSCESEGGVNESVRGNKKQEYLLLHVSLNAYSDIHVRLLATQVCVNQFDTTDSPNLRIELKDERFWSKFLF